MAEIYVSQNGNDSNNGSYKSPVKSVGRANALVKSGDKVFFERGGTWSGGNSLRLPSGAVADAYGEGAKPHLTKMSTSVTLAGTGAQAKNLKITSSVGPGVSFEANECVVDGLDVHGCCTDGTDNSRAIRGFNVKNPKVLNCIVHDTKGGDNVWFYNSPGVHMVGCDLARPGPKAGDNCQISGATNFYVAHNKFDEMAGSGKGHFIAMPWQFKSTGGVCEYNEFHGAANFAICLYQSQAIFRYNKIFGTGTKNTANWSSGFWCANADSFEPIENIRIYSNLVVNYRNGFGSWVPKNSVPAQLYFDYNTFVDCGTWFSYSGSAKITGKFENGIVVRSGAGNMGSVRLLDTNHFHKVGGQADSGDPQLDAEYFAKDAKAAKYGLRDEMRQEAQPEPTPEKPTPEPEPTPVEPEPPPTPETDEVMTMKLVSLTGEVTVQIEGEDKPRRIKLV